MSLTPLEDPPLRPRMGGRASGVLGLAGLLGAIAIFSLVLMLLNVIPNPFKDQTAGRPAPTSSPSLIQPPKPARFAQPHDCLQNIGTQDKPDMITVSCTSGSLEVLERIEGTTDFHECDKVSDYQFYYFYDSDLGDSLDFVLCMRKRP
jgi:hypothetical protein